MIPVKNHIKLYTCTYHEKQSNNLIPEVWCPFSVVVNGDRGLPGFLLVIQCDHVLCAFLPCCHVVMLLWSMNYGLWFLCCAAGW